MSNGKTQFQEYIEFKSRLQKDITRLIKQSEQSLKDKYPEWEIIGAEMEIIEGYGETISIREFHFKTRLAGQ